MNPADINWHAWHRATIQAARVMGCTIAELGEKRVTDVLQALHALRPDEPEDGTLVATFAREEEEVRSVDTRKITVLIPVQISDEKGGH